jgi:FixJ family two-component response regulator
MGDDVTESAPIVFVVEDDLSMQKVIERLLRSVGLATRSFGCAADFLAHVHRDAPACLVLDLNLPGQNGFELQRQVREWKPLLPVVFITAHADIPTSVRAIKAGAQEFLPKPFRDQDLLNAVLQALDAARAARDEHAKVAGLQQRFQLLTRREHEVLEWILAGLLNKQIAGRLGISEVTVKIHRARVMHKTEAKSIPDLVRMAERVGIEVAQP